jgi:poly-gamma-glutamate synthesis protein (capsule biosynthesis protein)
MNENAREIGMTKTNYSDPSGLSAQNYSTARDLFRLTNYLFTKHKTVFNITTLDRYTGAGRTWGNSNQFTRRDDYLGGKTGYTDAAHRTGVFIFSTELSDGKKRNIAIALLKTDDRTTDTNRILDYIRTNVYYTYKNPIEENNSEVTLGFVGDMMFDRGVKTSVIKNFDGDYNKILSEAPELKNPDIMFGNLEGPVSDKGTKVGSIYSFRMDPKVINTIKDAGFDIVSFANNHVGDYSTPAFLDTIGRLKEANILFTGAGENYSEASKTTIIERDGIRIGYLGVSDVGPEFMKAEETKPGIVLANDKNLDTLVKNAKASVDVLVVSIHWGDEYKPHNKRQETLAKRLIDNGADIIAGHHPHVPQDVEKYKDGLIIYSLGNFVFDQYFSSETMGGLYAKVIITKDGIKSHEEIPFKLNDKYQPILTGKKLILENTLPFERGNCPVGNSEIDEMFTNVSPNISVGKYIPEGLVEIKNKIKTKELRDLCMTEESATALHKMLTDASKDLIDLEVTSAFRSYDIQEILYAGRAQNVEKESIAKPGHSEHQLGTTIDFSSSEINSDSASIEFKSTKAYKWLSENAYKYGFVMSYPAGRAWWRNCR